jgi:hypothetical protein
MEEHFAVQHPDAKPAFATLEEQEKGPRCELCPGVFPGPCALLRHLKREHRKEGGFAARMAAFEREFGSETILKSKEAFF